MKGTSLLFPALLTAVLASTSASGVAAVGPQWTIRDIDQFQDNFAEVSGPATGTVRADMAANIVPDNQPGIVPGDSAVVTVADPNTLEISAELQSDDMQELAEGMPATMVLVSRPGEIFEGAIRKLPYPYGSGGGSDKVEEEDKTTRMSVEGGILESGIELGDLMRVTVVLEEKPGVLWLPPQAVRTFEGRNFVVVQDGEAQRRVDVKLGIKSDDRVEILEGLKDGQVIVGR